MCVLMLMLSCTSFSTISYLFFLSVFETPWDFNDLNMNYVNIESIILLYIVENIVNSVIRFRNTKINSFSNLKFPSLICFNTSPP